MTYKIELSSDEVPKQWYNMLADLPVELPAPKNSEGKDQIASLQKAFTKAGLEQEFSTERYIKIPNEVRELYMQMGRPSPLFRATKLEEYLNTPARSNLSVLMNSASSQKSSSVSPGKPTINVVRITTSGISFLSF